MCDFRHRGEKAPLLLDMAVLLLAAVLLFLQGWGMGETRLSSWWIFPAALCALLSYLLKGIRLYILVLGHWHNFREFLGVHSETTLVNLIYPMKLGELFRLYKLSVRLGRWDMGLTAILVDRFYDTLPLIGLTLLLTITVGITAPKVILALFVAFGVLVAVYLGFPSFHAFLNHYIMVSPASAFKLRVLRLLDQVQHWYDTVRELSSRRTLALLLLSVASWISELLALYLIGKGIGSPFSFPAFLEYLQDIFVGKQNPFSRCYLLIGILLFVVLVPCFRLAGRGGRKRS